MNMTAAMKNHTTNIAADSLPTRKRAMRVFAGAALLLGLIVLAVFVLGSGGDEEFPNTPSARGNDRDDLAMSRPKTGFSLSGTVTVNGQFPLGVGYVVAYDSSKSRATAYSSLDQYGNFTMSDVPPTYLILLVKKDLNSINPFHSRMDAGIPNGNRPDMNGGSREQFTPSFDKAPPLPDALKKAEPSIQALAAFKSEIYSRQFGEITEVEWMVNRAFHKYGEFTKRPRFFAKAEAGDRTVALDLIVP